MSLLNSLLVKGTLMVTNATTTTTATTSNPVLSAVKPLGTIITSDISGVFQWVAIIATPVLIIWQVVVMLLSTGDSLEGKQHRSLAVKHIWIIVIAGASIFIVATVVKAFMGQVSLL